MAAINVESPSYSEHVILMPADGVLPSLEEALKFTMKDNDYAWLEGDVAYRKEQKQAFVGEELYAPLFDYRKMLDRTVGDTVAQDPLENDGLIGSSNSDVAYLQRCITQIELHRAELGDTAEMYIEKHNRSILQEYLIQAAAMFHTCGNAEAKSVWKNAFMQLGVELYGEYDAATLQAMLQHIHIKSKTSDVPDDVLGTVLPLLNANTETDPSAINIIDEQLLQVYLPIIEAEYAHIFAAVPDTDNHIYYNASQTAELINNTLKAGGLYEAGWRAEVHPSRSGVATNSSTKRIYIPNDLSRNAHEIKKLVLHEQEVHARRAFNGAKAGYSFLEYGTANYADAEEGLGIILECIFDGTTDGNVAVQRAFDRYLHVGLALGADTGGKPRDARQTYEAAWRLMAISNSNSAVTDATIQDAKKGIWGSIVHIENIYRGTDFATPGMIYPKAKIYWEGLAKTAAILKEINGDIHRFRALFLGKYDHTSPKEADLVLSLS